MGTLRGDNGGERPQEGNGLPDLPPEWGTVIIPNDASELDTEGAPIRRQFRRDIRRRRWRARFHLPESSLRPDDDAPGLAVPLLIMSIAVVATLTSLFAVAWPGRRQPPTVRPNTAVTSVAAVSVGEVTLLDPTSAPVRLGDTSPAVILLVDACACQELIVATAGAVGPPRGGSGGSVGSAGPQSGQVTVLVVAATAPPLPAPQPDGAPMRALADPNRSVRAAVPGLASAAGPSALLIASSGVVVRTVPRVESIEEFRADLPRLT